MMRLGPEEHQYCFTWILFQGSYSIEKAILISSHKGGQGESRGMDVSVIKGRVAISSGEIKLSLTVFLYVSIPSYRKSLFSNQCLWFKCR